MTILDPRPESIARGAPYLGAANIPLSQLTALRHELPAPGETVRVARGEETEAAVRALAELGRPSEIVDPQPAERFVQVPLWDLNPTLARAIEGMAPGKAIDLGCGSGRDAVGLAARGWSVTGVDHLPDALERLAELSRRYVPENPVRTVEADLFRIVPDGTFDLAWMAYGLFERAFRECDAAVKVVETFAPCHREHYGKPSRVLSLEDCRAWDLGEEIFGEEGWRKERCTVRFAVWALPGA